MSTFTEGHALLVGVGADLANTTDDAKEMNAILTDEERCAYPPEQVQLLTGEKATRADVLAGLDQLAKTATQNSTVIVYFSGHGYQVNTLTGAVHFLMPFGYSVSNLPGTAISGQEFAQKLQAIPAQKLLLLLDCCHAGGLDPENVPGATLAKAPLPPEAAAMLAQGSGRSLIASSRADELSYAGKPCSAFTLALLEAFCGDGASQPDGQVWVTDLFGHTREKVPQRTGGKQHPIYNHKEADNFVVAFYAGGEAQAKGLPTHLQNVEIEPEPGAFAGVVMNQQGQTVRGNQLNITGTVSGPVVGGNVGRIGDTHSTRTVHTGGGTYVERDVNVTGGDFVGRDKVQVSGGFYQPGWTVGTVNQSLGDITQHFAPLEAAVQAGPVENRPQAQAKVEELKAEAAKGERADDEKMASLVEELGGLVPGAVEALVGLFAPGALGKLAGGATKYVLRRIRRQ
ncbi:MAG TPA: caspase family protein [Caldilineaceae bacterium]|nr:caspase family protein [Caldilineaceae bacterium]